MLPSEYICLKNQSYEQNGFSIVPIRYEDRLEIMKWRNDQIYHLRQDKPLTEKDQNLYFKNTIAKLFQKENPNQILFSFLRENICIGYGGLVHINWIDKNAEISFVIDTKLESEYFITLWRSFITLLEKVAFEEILLHKIFTYAYDLRPQLYDAIEKIGFDKEAVLKEHCLFNKKFIDVIIHSKTINKCLNLRKLKKKDIRILFDWVNNISVRDNSINTDQIKWLDHKKWFLSRINEQNCKIFILELFDVPIGQIRFEYNANFWEIDYSITSKYRSRGFGRKLIEMGIKKLQKQSLIKASVKKQNISSCKIFEKLGFKKESNTDKMNIYTKII